MRLLLFIAAPVALCAPTPDTHQQHILTAWEAGTPATWKGFAERPPAHVAATTTAAGDAARATRAATLAAIQAAGREAAAELDAAAAKLDAHALPAPAGSDALVGAAPPVGAVPPVGATPGAVGLDGGGIGGFFPGGNQNNVNVNVNYPGGGEGGGYNPGGGGGGYNPGGGAGGGGGYSGGGGAPADGAAAVGGGSAAVGGGYAGAAPVPAVGAAAGAPPPAASALAVGATVGAPPPAASAPGSGSSEYESGGEAAADDIEDTDGIIGGCGSHEKLPGLDSIGIGFDAVRGTRAGAGLRVVRSNSPSVSPALPDAEPAEPADAPARSQCPYRPPVFQQVQMLARQDLSVSQWH